MPKSNLTAEQVDLFITLANARLMVAILILLGMVAVAFAAISLAFGYRKTGFVFLAIYGGLMSFLGIGLSYIFGPVVLVASQGGVAREWLSGPAKPAQ